jgi:DNA-directed RNA polymerase subunit RPC12/RpoP
MRRLTAAEVLAVWEAGLSQHPLERALSMLAPALADTSREQLAALPIAERDRLLGRLHVQEFGPRLDCYTECPACGERLDFTATVPDTAEPPVPDGNPVRSGGRAPDSNDLLAASRFPDVEQARAELIRRCVAPEVGSEQTVDELLAGLEEAESLVDLTCPDCGHRWQEVLEVGEFVWQRMAQRAKQQLWEVHMLASAYGWSEKDILGMNPGRRRLYLEMLG